MTPDGASGSWDSGSLRSRICGSVSRRTVSGMGGQAGMCLFPLQASRRCTTMTRGAEGAVRELTALLECRSRRDAQSQWLLNVAYMQLGHLSAGGVPARWLIPSEPFCFRGKALPEFPEIAASAGLDIFGHAGGVIVEDFDGDGQLDVMVTSSGPLGPDASLFHNNGDGTFRDVTRRVWFDGRDGWPESYC